MRCKICNTVLTKNELTVKDRRTGAYLDRCGSCTQNIAETIFNREFSEIIVDIKED